MITISKLRSYRVMGIAMFDLILGVVSMIILFMISRRVYFKNLKVLPFIISAILLTVPIGIFFHVITGTNTTLNYRLGLSNSV